MKKPDLIDYEYADRSIYRRDLEKFIDHVEQQNKELIEFIEENVMSLVQYAEPNVYKSLIELIKTNKE